MPRPPSDQPTDGELEILAVLWEIQPAELKQVHAALNERRKVATTTVATMLGVMLDKKLVHRDGGPRGYLWSAAVSKDDAARGLVGKLVDRLFEGSSSQLVAHLIQGGQLSAAEQAEIEVLLSAARSKKSPRGGKQK